MGDRGEQGGAHPVGLRLQLAVGQPFVEIDPGQRGADIGEQGLQLMLSRRGERIGQHYPQHQFIAEVVVLGLTALRVAVWAPALCFWARHQSMAALSVCPGLCWVEPALCW